MNKKKITGLWITAIALALLASFVIAGGTLPTADASIPLERSKTNALKQWHKLDSIGGGIGESVLDLNTGVCTAHLDVNGLFNKDIRFQSEKGECLEKDRDQAIQEAYELAGETAELRIARQAGKQTKLGEGKVTVTAK